MCHHTIVVPAKPRDNFWSFLHPLTYQVWIGILISAPLFSLAMALTNRIFYKHMDWENVVAFVLRPGEVKVMVWQSMVLFTLGDTVVEMVMFELGWGEGRDWHSVIQHKNI